jgi:hypothetical protein
MVVNGWAGAAADAGGNVQGPAVAQTLSHAAALARPDPLELWRAADRAARHAEIRLPQHAAVLVRSGASTADVQEALALRRKANELLRAALSDLEHGAPPVPA